MLNPDGVIVGNYRCSLQARDLNRNYRHPRRDNFPTVFNVKRLVENLAETVGVRILSTEALLVQVSKLLLITRKTHLCTELSSMATR